MNQPSSDQRCFNLLEFECLILSFLISYRMWNIPAIEITITTMPIICATNSRDNFSFLYYFFFLFSCSFCLFRSHLLCVVFVFSSSSICICSVWYIVVVTLLLVIECRCFFFFFYSSMLLLLSFFLLILHFDFDFILVHCCSKCLVCFFSFDGSYTFSSSNVYVCKGNEEDMSAFFLANKRLIFCQRMKTEFTVCP